MLSVNLKSWLLLSIVTSTQITHPHPHSWVGGLRDTHRKCTDWASRSECDRNPQYMCRYCKRSCRDFGFCEPPVGPPSRIHHRPWPTKPPPIIVTTPRPPPVSDAKDYHSWCCFWAKHGECYSNKQFMCSVCQKSCDTKGCTARNFWMFTPRPNFWQCPF